MSAQRPRSSRTPRSGFPWALLWLAVLIVITAWYFWYQRSASMPTAPAADVTTADTPWRLDAEPRAATDIVDADDSALVSGPREDGDRGADMLDPAALLADASEVESEEVVDEPRFPLPVGEDEPDGRELPAAGSSDPSILEALMALASRETLARFINLQDFARRFVVTVDHLPQQRVPGQWNALRPVPDPLVIADDGTGRMVLQEENFRRYDAIMQFAETLDPAVAARIYRHFYPLLQEQYQALGYPQGHLNDRVVEAIDDMLTAPAVTGPIVLVQPRVQYRFEDPSLESLSAGRKIMIRIGPEHAARMQDILRALRAQIVVQESGRQH